MNTAEPSPGTEDDPLIQLCTVCDAAIDISDEEPLAEIACPACGATQYVSGQVDNYELQQVVGRGGMGVVYKAYDQGLDRYVALKLMRRDKSSPAVVAQLAQEAAVTASINHPHVVRVFTSGIDHGRFFIAMELVDKGTLDDLIHLQGRVAEAQVLEVGAQIAQGLRAALQAGLIHRDVKPGNILFADAHTAKIVDFGLAMLIGDADPNAGEVWGTPYYVAPEKLDRRPEDFRSDMYSLGATLFHALAGRPPFEAEDASMVALKHLKSQSVSLQAFAPHVSNETAYVINRTLAKEPNERYQSYDELIEHLNYALEQLRASGGQAAPKQRLVLEGEEQQNAMGWITAAMVGLIVLIGIGLVVFRKQIFSEGDGASTPAALASGKGAGPFPEARAKLVANDPAAAIEIYRQAASGKLSPLQLEWARVGEGLAHLVAGDVAASKVPFEAVVTQPHFNSKGDEEKMDFFLRDLARELAAPTSMSAANAGRLDMNNYEAFAIFAHGVKNWALGKGADAAVLLRKFRNSKPAGSAAWIEELKPLATNLLEDQIAFQMAADQLKAAKRPEQRAQALVALRKSRGPFAAQAARLEKSVPAPKPVALPKFGEWSTAELGTPEIPPAVARDPSGTFTITAGGTDLWAAADAGVFVSKPQQGDFELIARIESLKPADPNSKAGLMVRDGLRADARNVALVVTGANGLSQQLRPKAAAQTTSVKAKAQPQAAPLYLKLVRKGDAITGFQSADGQAWTEVATSQMAGLAAATQIGFVVSAHQATATATAKVDNILLSPGP